MKSVKSIKDLKGKKVILRCDFNVPINDGKIADKFRLDKSLETINFLLKKNAKVMIIAHLGEDGKESLLPIFKYLKTKIKIQFSEKMDLSEIQNDFDKIKNGEVLLLENIRRFDGEKTNDSVLAKGFAKMCDIYVNDAFSVSHRNHMSIIGIPKYISGFAGILLEKEIISIEKSLKNPKKPVLAIMGGIKFSTKIPVIKSLLKIADFVFIGGAIANSFLKVKGLDIGKSISEENEEIAKLLKNKKITLPTDVVVGGQSKSKPATEILGEEMIYDIGTETIKNLSFVIQKSKTIIWNGPLGFCEGGYDKATKEALKSISKSKAYSVIGGGDTVAIISKLKKEKDFGFVSTGGGAMLDFIANKTLPGIKALK